jgi:allophanate hydrolase
MHAVPGTVERPGVSEASGGEAGAAILGELWLLSPATLGSLATMITHPMTLGPVELDDGSIVTGFGCSSPIGDDITHFGSWRDFIAQRAATSG